MRKQFAMLLCAVTLLLGALSPPAFAASRTHYPISVEEYAENGSDALRIKKVYQLSLSDDPAGIPTEDFERDGILYRLLDLTMKNEVGVDTQEYTETITQDSNTSDVSAILKQLDAQKDVTTDEGYSGVLLLDHTSISVKAKGYNTSTKNLSATRTYPNLSDADLSLIPKTVSDGGKTLTLNNVQWSNAYDEGGGQHFTATATYTGTISSRYATGYVVTANYTGQVSKTDCEIATYTAIFGGVRPQEPEPVPEDEPEMEPEPAPVKEETEIADEPVEEPAAAEPEPVPEEPETREEAKPTPNPTGVMVLSIAGCMGGCAALGAAIIWCSEKMKERGEHS